MSTQVVSHEHIHVPLARAGQQLREVYELHHNSADFWNAYQDIQDKLAHRFPEQHIEICHMLARLAQGLGAVERAVLVELDA